MSFSILVSGAQRLPNGNTLITCGPQGRLIEVTSDNEVVWEFVEPQSVFRATRVPWFWVPGNPAGYDDPWE